MNRQFQPSKQPQQPISMRPNPVQQRQIQPQQPKPPQDIIVIVKSEFGMNRVTVKSNQTFTELIQIIGKALNQKADKIKISVENKEINQIQMGKQVDSFPGFEDGTTINVKITQDQMMQEESPKKNVIYNVKGQIVPDEKVRTLEQHTLQNGQKSKDHVLSQLCNHGPTARCINCLDEKKKDEKDKEKTPDTKNCNHGPFGKCLNCSGATKEDLKKPPDTKLLCQHGPNGKCTHCIDAGQISNIKHVSFDQFLADAKLKCKGCHPADAKCNNCLPPTLLSYKVKKDCKNHAPWPQAMCNACLPPGVVLRRQVYRHVDYVEFLNIPEISNFVQYWTSKGKTEQRAGFLYGYYAEDQNYKNGVRAVVEAIYEPPQKGSMGSVEFLDDKFENEVNQIAVHLGLEKIGWIFTTINHDCFLTSDELRMAARFQQEFQVVHDSGCRVSKFLTVVLRPKKENPDEIVPEVYMISDQMQQLELDGVFTNSGRRKVLQVRKPENERDIIPNFVYEGKSVTEFEPDFFIVNVAHGYSPNSTYNILKLYDFPVENRSVAIKPSDVKTQLLKHKAKPSYVRYSNFHLLLFLCKLIDLDSITMLANFVGGEQEVPDQIEEVIKLYVNK